MECESPPKILELNAVCTTLPFVLKYQDFGPPEKSSGTALFCYLYDKNYAFKYITLITSRLAPGQTSRPRDSPPCAMKSFPQSDK